MQLGIIAWIYITIQTVFAVACSIASLYSIGSKNKQTQEIQDTSCTKMLRLWVKTTWKMKSIYSAFVVHVFDCTTDLLVITDWYNAERGLNRDNKVEHVDSRVMAWTSIGILIFYKVISTIGIYLTTKSTLRAFAQFCDLLLLEDIYNAHQRVVTEVKEKFHKKRTSPRGRSPSDVDASSFLSTTTTGSTKNISNQDESDDEKIDPSKEHMMMIKIEMTKQ